MVQLVEVDLIEQIGDLGGIGPVKTNGALSVLVPVMAPLLAVTPADAGMSAPVVT